MESKNNKWQYFTSFEKEPCKNEYLNKNLSGDINLRPTRQKPHILGLVSNNFFGIKGRSIMSGVYRFYLAIFQWLENYLKTQPRKIRVEFWWQYYNTFA